jgi:hypothetical protein
MDGLNSRLQANDDPQELADSAVARGKIGLTLTAALF